ncbi:MAG: glycosyltransferase family 2 protein [Flavobacteriales bacterium]|nr:glycosyltransferase family 2 protein [Flavobacteriales bacterium]
MKKVSVILTTYNGEKSIAQVITSIIQQEGVNEKFELELIIVDDCSTDNTVNIAKTFDVILETTPQNSGGPNRGRNIGLKRATGDFLCIADQDDVWIKHKIITLLPYLEEVPIVTSGYTVIDSNKNKEIVRINKSENGSLYFKENETFISKLEKSLKGQNTYLGAIIYGKELQHILFEETFGVVDFDWVLRLFKGNPSIEVSDSLYKRFVDEENLSLNEAYRKKDFYYSLMFIEEYMAEYPSQVKKSNLKIHGSRARYYYFIGEMRNARMYFRRSELSWKNVLYYLTTFVGSSFVKKHFNIFG